MNLQLIKLGRQVKEALQNTIAGGSFIQLEVELDEAKERTVGILHHLGQLGGV
jgi:hypothetical protein